MRDFGPPLDSHLQSCPAPALAYKSDFPLFHKPLRVPFGWIASVQKVLPPYSYAQGHKPLFDAHPALKAWLDRCQARTAFKTMWDTRAAEAA